MSHDHRHQTDVITTLFPQENIKMTRVRPGSPPQHSHEGPINQCERTSDDLYSEQQNLFHSNREDLTLFDECSLHRQSRGSLKALKVSRTPKCPPDMFVTRDDYEQPFYMFVFPPAALHGEHATRGYLELHGAIVDRKSESGQFFKLKHCRLQFIKTAMKTYKNKKLHHWRLKYN